MLSSVTQRLGTEIGCSLQDSESLAKAVLEALGHTTGLEDLTERVARRTSSSLGKALEVCEMVCPLLAEELDGAALARLQQGLPGQVLRLFERAERPSLPTPAPHRPVRRGQTLATGRPGSLHPLSEATPGHRESVAETTDPHGETKLSSARGTSTDRTRDTLATGRPGSRRGLSESEG